MKRGLCLNLTLLGIRVYDVTWAIDDEIHRSSSSQFPSKRIFQKTKHLEIIT